MWRLFAVLLPACAGKYWPHSPRNDPGDTEGSWSVGMLRDEARKGCCAWYLGEPPDIPERRDVVGDEGAAQGRTRSRRCTSARLDLVRNLLAVFDRHLDAAQMIGDAEAGKTIDDIAIDVFQMVVAHPCGCPISLERARPVNRPHPPGS